MKLKLVGKRHETGNIWSFVFEPQEKLEWQAGQSIRIEVPRHNYGYNERRFTISSLPTDGYLQITTRISDSEFKRDLNQLVIGNEINGYNIEGKLNWGKSDQPKLFISGGTGITLFNIAIRQALIDKKPLNISLLQSSRDSPHLFEKEFRQLEQDQDDFRLITSNKRLDADFIIKNVPNINDCLIHIAGPNEMVYELQKQLKNAGINDQKLQSEFLE